MWQILQDRLPITFNFLSDASCVFCPHGIRDRDHLFNDCEFIRKVHHFTSLFFQFPWDPSFDMAMKSMNKACKKRSSKSIISSMIWTETLPNVIAAECQSFWGGTL